MIPLHQYKSARAEADHLAGLIQAALLRAGVPEAEVSQVRALVARSGRAYIKFGALKIGSATKLLEALPLSEVQSVPSPELPADAFD
ncbi:hypothetical protein DY218_30550 [Streptomyces triticagri]|uniref:Uncharacterized protein n=1 Tax=Streptomyces triticagri TaxID=2293568 RepID=A0A372LW34_9ACTN|nr:hypothetical protein [Streptomyces triticagri]RFU82882.1 hypothetical protein DY218_30550 [Streptomyces triticagri]